MLLKIENLWLLIAVNEAQSRKFEFFLIIYIFCLLLGCGGVHVFTPVASIFIHSFKSIGFTSTWGTHMECGFRGSQNIFLLHFLCYFMSLMGGEVAVVWSTNALVKNIEGDVSLASPQPPLKVFIYVMLIFFVRTNNPLIPLPGIIIGSGRCCNVLFLSYH